MGVQIILQSCVLVLRKVMPAFSEMASNVLGHHRVAVCFHFCTSEVKSRQEDTIELKQFNVKISWLIIVDKTT